MPTGTGDCEMAVDMTTACVTAPLRSAMVTTADVISPVTRGREVDDQRNEDWQSWIDHRIVEWGRDPRQVDDDDLRLPTRVAVDCAVRLANLLNQQGLAPPTRIVPDANGGIVFERVGDRVFESIRISEDGMAEQCVFQDTRLVVRRGIAIPSAGLFS